jgi:hypothetical protein
MIGHSLYHHIWRIFQLLPTKEQSELFLYKFTECNIELEQFCDLMVNIFCSDIWIWCDNTATWTADKMFHIMCTVLH